MAPKSPVSNDRTNYYCGTRVSRQTYVADPAGSEKLHRLLNLLTVCPSQTSEKFIPLHCDSRHDGGGNEVSKRLQKLFKLYRLLFRLLTKPCVT